MLSRVSPAPSFSVFRLISRSVITIIGQGFAFNAQASLARVAPSSLVWLAYNYYCVVSASNGRKSIRESNRYSENTKRGKTSRMGGGRWERRKRDKFWEISSRTISVAESTLWKISKG